ncbi:50S ribosomal protein L20 [Erythrobacter sp. NAP1]|uniref:helix-turn-helix domain-containing protein n=1 Tax=Erythrobacter sp. NAP1 TaxID=237727 RepID=UPI0000687632|nr:AraC family transcriptional regulator [Erythrobacter sp. NAP1]EAQ28371.1 50S ribosomal protein L20 [Erythrobacter sp. NAP1]
MRNELGNAITIRFALPAEELRPYVTTYYCTEVAASPKEPVLEDYLHPEWANLRFMDEGWAQSAIGDAPLEASPAFSATGPTSKAARFRIGTGRSWGIGLMPLGWANFVDAPASDYADRTADGNADNAFAAFQPLARALAASTGDFASELRLIEAHMAQIAPTENASAQAIQRINAQLVDPELSKVADLADRVAMNVRSLERLSKRAFGFTPKLLLRRQRFLRSLAQFMLDPSLRWLSTLDYQYHDQAHFVRDFKRFMGMSPTAYSRLEKPLLVAAARARMAIAGEAVQGLHDPRNKGS